jgi:anti-anti-sigma factor
LKGLTHLWERRHLGSADSASDLLGPFATSMFVEAEMTLCSCIQTNAHRNESCARPGGQVLAPIGEIDLLTRDELRHDLAECAGDVVVDLAEVALLDAGGMGVLVDARVRLEHEGGSLVLEHPSSSVRRALEVGGLGNLLAS